jgi:tripartite-type tricarboxylate transporter receptor subunit TctC
MEAAVRQFVIGAVKLLVSVLLAATTLCAVADESYPDHTIRIIVPLSPGGSTDHMARLLASKLQARWGEPVIVENRPGANTIIGTELVARAKPDGYTLLVVSNTHDILPLVNAKLPYDAVRDFSPVATVSSARFVLLVHPSVPANTLQEFIAFAKQHPGQINFGSSGTGSGAHIAGEVFNAASGVQLQHIPYKGGAQSMTDAIGGQVQVSFNTPMIAAPYVRTGRLKALAVSGETRSSLLPNVPTFKEAGLPAYDERAWQGVLAPAGTPRPIIDRLAKEISSIFRSPEVAGQLQKEGVDSFTSTPDQFSDLMKRDMQRLTGVIRASDLKLGND